MNSLLQSNCVNAAAAGNSQNSLTLRCDCVTAAAPSLGPYRGGSGRVSWWQLHRCKTAADALCLLKCSACCCSLVFADLVELSCTQIWCRFIMTDWPLPEIARTVWHCVATAWLRRLPHWGRTTVFCCLDYMDGRLRDCCCCCFIGAV